MQYLFKSRCCAYVEMGWEPADNREHKIVNCPVPGCPRGNKTEVLKGNNSIKLENIK